MTEVVGEALITESSRGAPIGYMVIPQSPPITLMSGSHQRSVVDFKSSSIDNWAKTMLFRLGKRIYPADGTDAT